MTVFGYEFGYELDRVPPKTGTAGTPPFHRNDFPSGELIRYRSFTPDWKLFSVLLALARASNGASNGIFKIPRAFKDSIRKIP